MTVNVNANGTERNKKKQICEWECNMNKQVVGCT
jgi:hypothetical protein